MTQKQRMDEAYQLRKSGMTLKQIAEKLGISVPAVWKYLRLLPLDKRDEVESLTVTTNNGVHRTAVYNSHRRKHDTDPSTTQPEPLPVDARVHPRAVR